MDGKADRMRVDLISTNNQRSFIPSSPYNYVHPAAYLTPVIGCYISLEAKPTVREDTGVDGGPSQVWILAFAILMIYLNIIFELRVIKPLGRAVNIIINITKKIIWFLLIFAVFLMGFTHALLYVLHTRRYRPCNEREADGSCKDTDYPSKYPTDFFEAFTTTYFFIAGRYDPVGDSFDNGTAGLRIMMVLFFFFTVIILLNVLIALMNDAFNASEKEGEIAYWKLLSDVIVDMETVAMYIEGVSSHTGYVYYCANDEVVKKFQSKLDVLNIAELSLEAHKKTHERISEVRDTNICGKEEIKRLVEDTVTKDLGELRELVQLLVDRTGGHEHAWTLANVDTMDFAFQLSRYRVPNAASGWVSYVPLDRATLLFNVKGYRYFARIDRPVQTHSLDRILIRMFDSMQSQKRMVDLCHQGHWFGLWVL
ncbi:MAG: hypothetical protein J3Q66DRAFT_419173 [Benniella sp.]|nr:MAG: hypothetical protein J3Q66DRAFT_419173 [Benniella sp.]